MRVRKYRIFDVGQNSSYFNDESGTSLDNKAIVHKVANKCYLPANETLLSAIKENPDFKASFSISGVALEQFEKFAPEVIESFRSLVKTGNIELLSETYHHSLSALYSEEEFLNQVGLHRKKVKDLFDVTPSVFRNTELIYSNNIAKLVEKMGYKAILAEGADHILGWRSPAFVYRPVGTENLKLLLKHYRLSDDIAFRFSQRSWEGWPLTAPKFANWVSSHNGNLPDGRQVAQTINLFMDYETFGEHQWADTGIFEFLKHLPREILKNPDNNFVTPSEAADRFEPVAELDVPFHVSWADTERDLSAWIGNDLQKEALETLYALGREIVHIDDPELIEDWRKLQTSDHFYYMCTKWWNDGDVHKYFSPYESPYEAFIAYMNVMQDLRLRLEAAHKKQEHEIALHKMRPLRFSEV